MNLDLETPQIYASIGFSIETHDKIFTLIINNENNQKLYLKTQNDGVF